jgi:hypothetical protein
MPQSKQLDDRFSSTASKINATTQDGLWLRKISAFKAGVPALLTSSDIPFAKLAQAPCELSISTGSSHTRFETCHPK